MTFNFSVIIITTLAIFLTKKSDGYMICPNGHVCEDNYQVACCPAATTTNVTELAVSSTLDINAQHSTSDGEKYNWYSGWSLYLVAGVFFVVVSLCIWCIYHCLMRYMSIVACYCECCQLRNPETPSEHDSAGSCCPPPRYSRCSSLYRMPPAYSEVTSKPDMYPLVITCGNNDKGYLMVQYFRGPLSAASTAESINSSHLCNSANEANTIIPPPYSYASSEDRRPEAQRPLRSKPAVITPPRRRLPQTPYHRTHSVPSYDPELHYVDDEEMIAIDPILRNVVLSEGFYSPPHGPHGHNRRLETGSDSESDRSVGDNALSPTFFKRTGFFYKNETRRGLVDYVNQMGYKLRVTSAPTTPDDAYGLNRMPFRPRRGNSSTPKLYSRQKGDDEPLFDKNKSNNF